MAAKPRTINEFRAKYPRLYAAANAKPNPPFNPDAGKSASNNVYATMPGNGPAIPVTPPTGTMNSNLAEVLKRRYSKIAGAPGAQRPNEISPERVRYWSSSISGPKTPTNERITRAAIRRLNK